MPLTAVALTKEKDVQRNTYQETGIFVPHIKLNSKNNNNTTVTMLFTICLLSLYHIPQQCLATRTSTTLPSTFIKDVYKPNVPSAPYECGSLDLRNNCDDFYKLTNCTVITGFLNIAQLPRNESDCNFGDYQFVNLREITDFLIITEVRYMTSIKALFPNLAVIRGQQLLLNYALVITTNNDLEKLEFKSLIAIQRGHVLLDGNPKLCYVEKINWSRLTLRRGRNIIIWDKRSQCPDQAKCNGCKRDSCWSNDVCQKLENDSVLSLMQESTECHRLCLGGCYNHTAQGCVVCKGWSDHGTCVDVCPENKYASSHYLRCYTREECIQQKKLLIYKSTCVDTCPGGYKLNNATKECDSCRGINNCTRICSPKAGSDPVLYISSLMHAENLKGCEILNATVMVNINEYFDHENLMDFLKDVREITGHLKINRSPYLTSLKFFQNLEKIHGLVLENKLYALIVYNNKNLSELWLPQPGLEIINGGMYIHANDKLCNRHIAQFREKVKHDRSLDSVQTSDQEVLCSPAKLNLYVQVLNHRSLEFIWPQDQTSAEVEIIYRPVNDKEVIAEHSELDTDVCKRINWRRELKFSHELNNNATHYSYVINNLKPHTRYAGLVKTFNGEDIAQEARSEVKYATTLFDVPLPPNILIKSKCYDSLNIKFSPALSSLDNQVVDYYILTIYSLPDNKQQLDTRDYCDEPILNYKDRHEDYEDCCTRREEERKDQLFLQQLKKDFSCSLDRQEYCHVNERENNATNLTAVILSKRFEAWETNYTIRSLKRFHLYVLQLQACNHAGCSSYTMLSTRTNYSTAADKIYDFTACKMPHSYDYRVHFSEPLLPNGFITSYALHFRYSTGNNSKVKHNELLCITRLEHELNHFVYASRFNYTYNEAAVRVHSLGQHNFIGWFNITTCPSTKLAGRSQGWNIFLVFFFIGAGGTVIWICYKRRYWRKISQLRRYLPLGLKWRYLRPETDISEDRQMLVDGFETVRFHNSPDEDMKYLVH